MHLLLSVGCCHCLVEVQTLGTSCDGGKERREEFTFDGWGEGHSTFGFVPSVAHLVSPA